MISSATERIQTRREVVLALFSALAIGVHALEVLMPLPLPWLRPGLANILTLCALFLYGTRAAWLVTLTRIGIGSLLLGTLFSPSFFLALSGGLTATALMTLARAVAGDRLSPIGVSVVGASGHVIAQLSMAGWLLQHAGLWRLLPFLLLLALVTGTINGVVADLLLERLRQRLAQFSAPS
jgi:heptaprenyl diphosphate synthase